MKLTASILTFALIAFTALAGNTIVRFNTILGGFEVLLYDSTTPATVSNFLNYVHRGAYENTFFHRSVPGFVLQGGGFTIQSNSIFNVPVDPPVTNEFFHSNIRGTIAMAKLGGNPDSATSQWFFNLVDNTFLDQTNGGFTVFGRVLGEGLQVVDMLASVQAYNATNQLGGAFTDLPLLAPFLSAGNLLVVSNIVIVPFGIETIGRDDLVTTITWTGPSSTGVNVERSVVPGVDGWTMISQTNRAGFLRDEITPGTAMFYRLSLPD